MILENTIRKRTEDQHKLGLELEATCQICLKTKFADGVGHSCNYCGVRCCARCGGKVTLRSNKVSSLLNRMSFELFKSILAQRRLVKMKGVMKRELDGSNPLTGFMTSDELSLGLEQKRNEQPTVHSIPHSFAHGLMQLIQVIPSNLTSHSFSSRFHQDDLGLYSLSKETGASR